MPSRPRLPSAGAANPKESAPPPSVATSMLFALKPWPMVITVGAAELAFPSLPAADWLGALLSDDMLHELLALADDPAPIYEGLMDGSIDFGDLSSVLMEMITLLSGRPWWFSLGLVAACAGAWDTIGGYLALRGTTAANMSLQAWMDALLAAVLLHIKPEDRNSFITRLNRPPAGLNIEPEVVINAAREESVFYAQMKGQKG